MALVTFERRGAVGIVTLNRPERLNAISRSLTRDLHAVLSAANAEPDIAVIVFTGAGRAFCAGDDLKEFDQQAASPEAIEDHIEGIQAITRDLMFSEKIVVGAIRGFAVGGGFEWLLNCDLAVAADDLVCYFPEMDWGQFVTGGVSYLLPLAVGHQRAMELMLLGERQSAADLLRLGLVTRVTTGEEVLSTALAMAEKVASKSHFSIARLKRLVTQQLSPASLTRALELEREITIESFKTPDAAERVKRFLRRR